MLSLESSKDDEPVYELDYILAETFKSFYATIDGLTIDPVWIPKAAVNKNLTVKPWWVKLFKEGKTEWKKEEKKIIQTKLKHFFD
ncbi:MAG: hypothetical protein KAU62_01435 [Candidatus Heimdallarchaeota archaeon]|nr:hypothetical protein [Candidatus Heimdallarchaeota archaeon]MCK4609797.1 hypothetical protein [Candidatus Heimdallarchaeota archaeon]